MTITINASTSSGLVVTPDNSGNVLLQYNGQSAPAFSAYQSSAQTLPSGSTTKITFTTEEFDTNNNFASSTFTPTVAGYYQFNCGITAGASATVMILFFFKNGSAFYRVANTNPSTVSTVSGSNLIYCNGTTDYVEVHAFFTTGQVLATGQLGTYFNGCLLRGA